MNEIILYFTLNNPIIGGFHTLRLKKINIPDHLCYSANIYCIYREFYKTLRFLGKGIHFLFHQASIPNCPILVPVMCSPMSYASELGHIKSSKYRE